MATDVKNRIAEVFEAQAKAVGLDKVTVGAIVAECHISRQAFYYYYQDVVDVARYVLKEKLTMVWSDGEEAETPRKAVRIFARQLVEQFPIIAIAMNSKFRVEMELLLIKELQEFFRVVLIRQNCGKDLTVKQIGFQSDLLACGIAGYALEHCNEPAFDAEEFADQLWDMLKRSYGEL
ncbi:MAG: TetR family transcriptional regulator [Eggerthellaceae bacterium]|nr:TetR family transcriptional regulator [Eggerthellaceae bacterium]